MLGEILNDDDSGHTNHEEAARFFLEAAKKGVWEAEFELSRMYFEGRGVPQRNNSGLLFFLLSEANFVDTTYSALDKLARSKLDQLNIVMQDAEILESYQSIQKWRRKYPRSH